METPRLRRSLFGYSRKSVRVVLTEREATAIKASADAREAQNQVHELSSRLEESRRDTAELQARTRDLDAKLKEATERFRVLDQSSSPSTSEGLTEVLHAAERALGRLTESARRNAEQELELTERQRDDVRTDIDRLVAWRERTLPLAESVPDAIEEVRREASAAAARLREALGPLTESMDVLSGRLSELAEISAAPVETAADGDVIRLEDAAETEVPPAPQSGPSVWAPGRKASSSAG
jgi:septation ring formation regulator EzrA